MFDPVEDFLAEATPDALPWVRKRDSSVVAFDNGKLASSIFAAFEQLGVEDAAFRAQELTRAVLHFLAEEFEGRIPTTEEISETVVKVLREVGQGPAAKAYFDFRCRRQTLRSDLDILQTKESEADEAETRDRSPAEDLDRLRSWDKSKVAWALQEELELDSATARDIATAVERKLLVINFERISSGLIRELINCELLERGLHRLLDLRRLLTVPASRLHGMLERPGGLKDIHYRIGEEILEQFALQEVFSRDVAGLHHEGLLHLFDMSSPCHWPSMSADLPALAMRSADESCMLDQLEENLHKDASRVAGVLALEALDSVMALSASPTADPSAVSEKVHHILRRLLRVHPVRLVINLYGRIPEFVANWLSEGPLFQVRPTELQDRFANAFAEALTQRIVAEKELARRCRVDFHPDVDLHDEDFRLVVKPWARWSLAAENVCVCFDRGDVDLAEGLSWNPLGRSGVFQYVGVNLMALHRKLGSPRDDEALLQRLILLCGSAVRAGVQRREFLRRQQPGWLGSGDRHVSTMVLVPLGLDQLAREMFDYGLAESEAATDFAAQLVRTMRQRVFREGKHYQLACRIDGLPTIAAGDFSSSYKGLEFPGPTPFSSDSSSTNQIQSAGRLVQAAGGGTAVCRLAADAASVETVVDLLSYAKQATCVSRIRFQIPVEAHQRELFDVRSAT